MVKGEGDGQRALMKFQGKEMKIREYNLPKYIVHRTSSNPQGI